MTLQYTVFFNSISAILGQYENGYESIYRYAMKHISPPARRLHYSVRLGMYVPFSFMVFTELYYSENS